MSLTRDSKDAIKDLCDGIPAAVSWWNDQGESLGIARPETAKRYATPDIVTVANFLDDWRWNNMGENVTFVALRAFELCMQREMAKRKASV